MYLVNSFFPPGIVLLSFSFGQNFELSLILKIIIKINFPQNISKNRFFICHVGATSANGRLWAPAWRGGEGSQKSDRANAGPSNPAD